MEAKQEFPKLRELPEFGFACKFMTNYLNILSYQGYNKTAFFRLHNISSSKIYGIKSGSHNRSVTLRFLAVLANTVNMSIDEVYNYQGIQ